MIDETLAIQPIEADTLKPPTDSRVGTASAIRGRIAEMLRQDRTRADNRRVMKSWFNGARPYDQGMLDSKGQGDRTNFNPREAEAMRDTAKTPFYTMIFRNPRFLQISCDYGYQMQRRAEWSEKISKYAHQMLSEWDEHDYNVQLYQSDMSTWGVGHTVWPDDSNWQWEHVKINHFLVPDETPSNVKKFEECAVFKSWNPVDLWDLIKKESAATMGWFPERVKRALVHAAPHTLRNQPGFGNQWSEDYESSLRRGDIDWNGSTAQVRTWHYLVREFSGKVSECIVLEDASMAQADTSTEDESLLFKRVGRYKAFYEKICPFPFDVGEGELHSVKGLGPKIFDNSMVSARLLCDTVDGARRSATLILEAQEATTELETQLVTINGGTVIGPGFKAVQNRISTDMEGPMRVREVLDSIVSKNSAQYKIRLLEGDTNAPTLGQEQLNVQQENSLSEAAFDRYGKRLDAQYYEIIRRALKLGVKLYKARHPNDGLEKPDTTEVDEEGGQAGAYWFVRRCVEDDVPIEALDMKWICSVMATRGIGGGSPAAMDMATRSAMAELYPLSDERGKRHLVRLRSNFLLGQAHTDVAFPEFGEADVPNDHEWAAKQENNDASDPLAELEVTPRQDHVIHFTKHFERASKMVQASQQGQINPMMTLMTLHILGPHMKEHLDAMVGDPTRKAQLEQLTLAWVALSKVADQMQQQVDEAQQAQQKAQPKPDPALVAAMAKVQGELQIKAFKAHGDMALKAQKQEQALRLKDIANAQDYRHGEQQIQLETLKALPQPGSETASAAA